MIKGYMDGENWPPLTTQTPQPIVTMWKIFHTDYMTMCR